jgi:hypothetical protein
VRSVYAEYRQGSRSLQIAVHDMGAEAQARNIFRFDLPPARENVSGNDDVVIDLGLATSYAVKAVSNEFYFELSIDEKSDAAKQSLKLFALDVLDRARNAGANQVPGPRPFFSAARVAASPASGLELGGRALQQTAGPPVAGSGAAGSSVQAPGIRSAGFDARYERAVGEGRLTAYSEAMGTQAAEPGGRQGAGAMARLRLSEPFLEGAASGRVQSPGYLPLTSDRTLYGALRNEGTLQATAYPARWLPATVFFTRQLSAADAGGEGTVQHALARLQLNRERLPATSLQLGQTLLDAPTGAHTDRVRFVGQTEYDLAQGPLAFLGVRRFDVRGLYGLSDATTSQGGAFTRADRVDQVRLEARLAPTSTESAYALFRWRRSAFRLTGADWATGIRHWELNAGARSAALPGLVPQLVYGVIDDDDRVTGPVPVQSLKGSLGAQLSVFPGQWVRALSPVLLDTRYSLAADDRTEGGLKTLGRRVHRVDNRFIYAGVERLDLELFQVVELPFAGPDSRRDGRRVELGNRVVLRPAAVSPVTLRLDYTELETSNDTTTVPSAPALGKQTTYEGALEWLMRWTRAFSTRVKGTYSRSETRDTLSPDPTSGALEVRSFIQRRAGPELELRLLVAGQDGSLYLVQRNAFFRLFGEGDGAILGAGFDTSLGAIWTLGDNVYLDSQVAYHRLNCFAGPCVPVSTIEPRMLLSARL